MAGVDDKITNGLLIWGNASAAASDLAVLTIAENGTTPGANPGENVYSDVLNSGIRSGTILSYCLIEALKKGPSSDLSETASEYTSAWYEALDPVSFDYKTQDVSLGDFSDGLNSVINAYLKSAQTYFSLRANVWNHARNFVVKDADESHSGTSVSVDGSQDYVFKLPSTIKATIIGSADDVDKTIKGVSIGDIFVSDGGTGITSKAKAAAKADKAYVTKENTLSADTYPLVLGDNAASSDKALKQRSGVQYNENAKALEAPGFKGPNFLGNYCSCSTANSTAAKTAQLDGFVLQTGSVVLVKFTYGNTAANPTLNINSTGAAPIKIGGMAAAGSPDRSWRSNDVVELVYDGSAWNIVRTMPQTGRYGICASSYAETAKTASVDGFVLEIGATVILQFTNYNSTANSTLNVSGTGAYPIVINGLFTVADQLAVNSWRAYEVCTLVFDGSFWRLIKPKVVELAQGAVAAVTASSADTADTANSATVAEKLGTATIGTLKKPVYLNQGAPSAGYYRDSWFSSMKVYKASGTGAVTSLSFSQVSLSTGTWYFMAKCWQDTDTEIYSIEADLTTKYDMDNDSWVRIDLREIVKAFFQSGSYGQVERFYGSDYWSCTASFRKDNLDGFPSMLVTYMDNPATATAYAYIGCDQKQSATNGICAHVSFRFKRI